MQNVIVGTAGHVDHGKTCLIKALTGVDTDRLKEEKKRGITIELGFANLKNDADLHIGIIDVPGHEKFVKNMLAGIGGIDLCLLVVALDEGVMPQTVEHFEIIKNLEIPKGIVVYTKKDLMDEDMFELIDDDVTTLLEGSFMEGAERIAVSSFTGENMDYLRERILELVKDIRPRRNDRELFRLPVDRVFTMEGFGTVVTGTLLEGSCEVNEEVQLYPSGRLVKIRQIQSHNDSVPEADAGQRTALNLAGIHKDEISRGDVLAFKDSMTLSHNVDAALTLFSSTDRGLKNGDRIHFNYGSAQTECRAMLLSSSEIGPGEKCYVQFRFDEPVPVKRGDRFIVRFLSPVESFGGGTVIAVDENRHKKNDEDLLRRLKLKETGTPEDVLELEISEHGNELPAACWLSEKVNLTLKETEKALKKLVAAGKALNLSEEYYIDPAKWLSAIEEGTRLLSAFHEENPILPGMPKEEFRYQLSKFLGIHDSRRGDVLVNAMISRKKIAAKGAAVANPGFAANYSEENLTMREDIEALYKEAGYEVPATEDVVNRFKDTKLARQIINDLTKSGVLTKIDNNAYINTECMEGLILRITAYFETHDSITLAEFRDLLSTSRKYALLILDYFDRKKLTKMVGDARIPFKKK